MIDAEQEPGAAPPAIEAPPVPPVATIIVSFAPGTLEMGIATSGVVTQSHLWAASALMDKLATQMWQTNQALMQQRAAQEKAAIQSVAKGLQLERAGRRT